MEVAKFVHDLGELRVKLDRKQYTAGDLLQGKGCLRVHKRVHISDFTVVIEGREHISWGDKSGSTGTSGSSTPRRQHNKDVLRTQITLVDAPAKYQPGAYEFPFSYLLPESLPNSFNIEDRQLIEMWDIESYISYNVRASIRAVGALNPNIEACRQFVLQRPPLDHPVRPVEKFSTERVRVFRVLSRGICTLSASLDHDVVSAGDTLTVFTSVYNQSSKDMMGMSVRLIEDLAVDVPFRTQKRGSTVICRRDFPGVRAGRQSDRALSVNLVTETRWSVESINPTMACHFIQWKYRLVVTCSFRLCGNVKVEFPVTVSCPSRAARMSMARMSGIFSSPVGVENVPLGPRSMPRILSTRISNIRQDTKAIPQSSN